MTPMQSALLCIALIAGQSGAAAPFDPVEGPARSMDATAYGGTIMLDSDLADYRWKTGPLPVWGARLIVHQDRFAAGMRIWSTKTTQEIGILGIQEKPTVLLESAAIVGEYLLGEIFTAELSLTGTAGLMHIVYSPDQIVLEGYEVTGLDEPLEVDLKPLWEWTGGVGADLKRRLPGGLLVTAGFERSSFGLDTAHRNGASIEEKRKYFGYWIYRVELGWRAGNR